jgi:hypothetical protein
MDNAGLGSQPPDISPWEIGTGKSADLSVGESSLTKSADREFLDNPMPSTLSVFHIVKSGLCYQ